MNVVIRETKKDKMNTHCSTSCKCQTPKVCVVLYVNLSFLSSYLKHKHLLLQRLPSVQMVSGIRAKNETNSRVFSVKEVQRSKKTIAVLRFN